MELTAKFLWAFSDEEIGGWKLDRWLVKNGQRVERATPIAIFTNSETVCELEAFDSGFLKQEIVAGTKITPETVITTTLKPEDLVPLDFALKRIYENKLYDNDLVMSAVTLCEHSDTIANSHLLHCLNFDGSVAEWGARGLYAKTHRDGIDRFTNSDSFSTNRQDWESYLEEEN